MKNEDAIKYMEASFTGVRGILRAMEDGIEKRFDMIDESNKLRNHRLEKAEGAIVDLEKKDISFENYQSNCSANKMANGLKKPRTWLVMGVAMVGVIFLSIWLFHNIDWLKTFENRTGIEIIDE